MIMLIIETNDENVVENLCDWMDNDRYKYSGEEAYKYRVSSEMEERRSVMDKLYKHLVSRKEHLAEMRHQEKDEFSDPNYLARLDEITNILVHFEEVKL